MNSVGKGQIILGATFLALVGAATAMLMAEPVATPETAQAATAPVAIASEKPAETQPSAGKAALAPEPEAEAVAIADDSPFVIKSVLPINGPIKYGEWHWNDKDVPDGPIVITVDLDARVLSIFRHGYEIGAAAVLLGTQEKPTPTGVFPITQKKRHHVSNIYGAPMPYMQRLTNDGISLHASEVEWGYASHGCIGMPAPFAAKVFSKTKLGDRVFITRGKMVGIGDALAES